MYRSFASLRMTTKRNRVILSEAKDLYDSNSGNVLIIPQEVKNLLFCPSTPYALFPFFTASPKIV